MPLQRGGPRCLTPPTSRPPTSCPSVRRRAAAGDQGPEEVLPRTQGILFRKTVGHVHAVDGVDLAPAPRRDRRHGRGVRLRQVDGRQAARGAREAHGGSIIYKGQDLATMGGRALKQYRREVQIIFQDPYALAVSRMTVGDIVAEGWSVHSDVAPRKGPRLQRNAGTDRTRRAQPRSREPVPAPVLRRPAPAHRHRPGPGPAARRSSSATSRSRRWTSRCRPRWSTCSTTCRTARACPTCSSRTTCQSSATCPTAIAVMYLGSVVEEGPRNRSTGRRRIRTRRRCSRASAPRAGAARARRTGSCCRATFRARPTRPRAAGSVRAAGRRRTSARPRRRPWSTADRATRPPATSPRQGDRSRRACRSERPVGSAVRQPIDGCPIADRRRLLLVHAHPDDETINNGATMARYVAEGASVTLLTCTLGEEGEILVPELEQLAADQADQLGGYRIWELRAAMAALGVTDFRFLGGPGRYRDSGMMGTPANENPARLLERRPRRGGRARRRRCARGAARRWSSPTTRTAATATPTTSRPTGSRWRALDAAADPAYRPDLGRALDGREGLLELRSALGAAAGHRRDGGGRRGVLLRGC